MLISFLPFMLLVVLKIIIIKMIFVHDAKFASSGVKQLAIEMQSFKQHKRTSISKLTLHENRKICSLCAPLKAFWQGSQTASGVISYEGNFRVQTRQESTIFLKVNFILISYNICLINLINSKYTSIYYQ